jgi:hypothetical protein
MNKDTNIPLTQEEVEILNVIRQFFPVESFYIGHKCQLIKAFKDFGDQRYEQGKKDAALIDEYLLSLSDEELLTKINWKAVFEELEKYKIACEKINPASPMAVAENLEQLLKLIKQAHQKDIDGDMVWWNELDILLTKIQQKKA